MNFTTDMISHRLLSVGPPTFAMSPFRIVESFAVLSDADFIFCLYMSFVSNLTLRYITAFLVRIVSDQSSTTMVLRRYSVFSKHYYLRLLCNEAETVVLNPSRYSSHNFVESSLCNTTSAMSSTYPTKKRLQAFSCSRRF